MAIAITLALVLSLASASCTPLLSPVGSLIPAVFQPLLCSSHVHNLPLFLSLLLVLEVIADSRELIAFLFGLKHVVRPTVPTAPAPSSSSSSAITSPQPPPAAPSIIFRLFSVAGSALALWQAVKRSYAVVVCFVFVLVLSDALAHL
jgi:hypothetical protein